LTGFESWFLTVGGLVVGAGAGAVTDQMRHLTGRSDAQDTALWQEAFSAKEPQDGAPRLRWPGDPDDRHVKNMNDGLRLFAPGCNMVIRNPAAHGHEDLPQQDALEALAAISLLARLVDACEVHTAPPRE
jgi:hypothetical protein